MKRTISPLTEDQASQLLREGMSPTQERNRQLIAFLLHTGLKIHEFVGLNVRDVFSGKRVRRALVLPSRKSAAAHHIPLDREAREAIACLLAYHHRSRVEQQLDAPFVASRQRNAKDRSYRMSARQVQRIVKGMGTDQAFRFRTTPQMLRHTFATSLLNRGVDLRTVQRLLGHGTVKTTRDLYVRRTEPPPLSGLSDFPIQVPEPRESIVPSV